MLWYFGAAYPLLMENRLVGVLTMHTPQPLNQATLDAFTSVGSQIALGQSPFAWELDDVVLTSPQTLDANPSRDRRKVENIIRYHRPMLEDGEISYEFYYAPEVKLTAPASDTDRGKLVPGLRGVDESPVLVEPPDLTKLFWELKDDVKEFHLHCRHTQREFLPDMWFNVWGFNDSMPGPTIEAVEGDRVRIVVHNELPESTTLHWHGLEVPNRMDGVHGLNQDPIKPGTSFVYEFDLHQNGDADLCREWHQPDTGPPGHLRRHEIHRQQSATARPRCRAELRSLFAAERRERGRQ